MTRRPSIFPPAYYAWLCAVMVATYLVHEGAHYATGRALGLDMQFGLNMVTFLSPAEQWQRALVSAGGPLVTIVQAVVAFLLVMRGARARAFAFLYAGAFMRAVATGVTLLNPNDEARISMYLGLGKWTLPLLVTCGLVALVIVASRKLKLTWKDQFFCYLAGSLTATLMVGLDRFVF